jgi:hypothetical protein
MTVNRYRFRAVFWRGRRSRSRLDSFVALHVRMSLRESRRADGGRGSGGGACGVRSYCQAYIEIIDATPLEVADVAASNVTITGNRIKQ